MKKELILVDASWVIHRMWHVHSALSVMLGTGIELKSGHLYGFSRLLKTFNKNYPEADICVCLDGVATHGKALNQEYKGNREHSDVKHAFNDLGVLIECMVAFNNVIVAFNRDLEADEIISYLCDKNTDNYEKIIVYSADGDMLQLIGNNVFVAKEFENGLLKLVDENTYYTSEKYFDKFNGCKICNLPLYRAMVGDNSDNLRGIPRLRKRLAKELAEKYCTVEALSEAVGKDDLFPDGFEEFLPLIRVNFEIMKLPKVVDLVSRGVEPRYYTGGDKSVASSMFSLYRIKTASPVDTCIVDKNNEELFLNLRDEINGVWKHPNSDK